MAKKFIYMALGGVVVIAIAAIAAATWLAMEASQGPDGPSAYSAVYLTSGDVYFGKLSWFPQPHLADAWYLQRSVAQSGQPQFAVAPFKDVFWGPVDALTLNPQQILFTTRLANSSRLVYGFEHPSSAEPTQVSADELPGAASASSPTPSATSTKH